MSDISLTGIFGALCVILTIGIGVVGLMVAVVVSAIRGASGGISFPGALKRTIAGPVACTVIGLLGLALLAGASNDTVDDVGPFVVLAGVVGGTAAGIVVSRRLKRGAQAPELQRSQ